MKKKTIVDVFDPYNKSHLSAWRFMEETGSWPIWFFDEVGTTVEIPNLWHVMIMSKLAQAWIDYRLGDD